MIYRLLSANIKEEIKLRKKYYHYNKKDSEYKPLAIFCLDGRTYTNGLADRLRGMVSIYLYSKLNNLEFKIEHIDPFYIEDYLQPNKYNWLLKKNDKTYNIKNANPICLFDYTKGLRLFFLSKNKQHHFYTNIDCISLLNKKYNTNYTFSELYNELFKPSDKLLYNINECLKQIGPEYVSISFRFMKLLGDFEDAWGNTLQPEEQEILIKKSLEVVKNLKERTSCPKILVTSDSQKFINKVKEIPYAYIIPGEIGHIGNSPNSNIYMKTFLDFYMISRAEKIFLGVSGEMYKSNYAKTASYISNKEFEIINY